METCCEKFKLFYMQEHQGRKLSWLPHLSKGTDRIHIEVILCRRGQQISSCDGVSPMFRL